MFITNFFLWKNIIKIWCTKFSQISIGVNLLKKENFQNLTNKYVKSKVVPIMHIAVINFKKISTNNLFIYICFFI